MERLVLEVRVCDVMRHQPSDARVAVRHQTGGVMQVPPLKPQLDIKDMRYLLFTVHSTAATADAITVITDTQYGYFSADTIRQR